MVTKLKQLAARGVDLSLLLGVAGTVGFYAVILQPSMHGTLLHRYTTEAPVDYVIVAMFIWGVVDLFMKTAGFPREMLALRESWLPPRSGREPLCRAEELLQTVRQKPRWLTESRIGQRLIAALDFVVQNRSVEEYRDHLQYLSTQGQDDTYTRYTLARFVIAVTPILGFLGTVVHFGTALSGISFDDMANRLPEVVSEMGSAFNTTTVALAAAMAMMFGLFLCERLEHGIDAAIDRYLDRELQHRFEIQHENLTPFLKVLQHANDEALRVFAGTLDRQVTAWTQSFNTLLERFDEHQQQESAAWTTALESLERRHESVEGRSEQRHGQLLTQIESRQSQQLAVIQRTLESIAGLRDDFRDVGKTFHALTEGESKLLELQHVLTENLRLLHETQQFDEALHGLTAAIHLLTKRHRFGGNQDSIAA
jgi:biopolymer transport protein ExbB/TolQ